MDDIDRLSRVSMVRDSHIETIPFHADGTLWVSTLNPKPVVLTDVVVSNFGFSEQGYKSGYSAIKVIHPGSTTTDFVITKPGKLGEWQTYYVFDFDEYRFIKLEFAHDLQNLFNAMTKLELDYEISN